MDRLRDAAEVAGILNMELFCRPHGIQIMCGETWGKLVPWQDIENAKANILLIRMRELYQATLGQT